jgi:hypothetical protein
MASSKDHTDISVYNILRSAIRSLSANEQQPSEDLMSQLREEARRQTAKDEEEAMKKFLSYVTVDRHQKITKHGEIEIAYLLPSFQISNVSKSDDIQFFKQQQDEMKQQIGGLEETIRKLAHTFEKFVAPSFSSYETSNMISVSNTSVTNGDLQPQPLYGMSMNSYQGQIPRPPSLLDRSSNLDMTAPSASNRGQSNSLYRTVQTHARTTTWPLSGGKHDWTVWIYPRTIRQCTGPSGHLDRTVQIRICRTCCSAKHTKLLYTTTIICSSPYISESWRAMRS